MSERFHAKLRKIRDKLLDLVRMGVSIHVDQTEAYLMKLGGMSNQEIFFHGTSKNEKWKVIVSRDQGRYLGEEEKVIS